MESATLINYKNTMMRMLPLSFPTLQKQELSKAIDYSIKKRLRNAECNIHNNYRNTLANSNLLDVCDYIEDNKYIMTAYGTLFERHKEVHNPLYRVLDVFINNRIKFKKEMFKYPKGSEEFKKYNMLQLLAKLDANASYGVLGAYSSLLYNIYIAASTTSQGRACISHAILFFEQFLANNVRFGSLNEVITFIDNVVEEKKERKYNDSAILDEDITMEEAFFKLMSTCGFNWFPTEKELQIVWDIMSRLSQEDINRIYYKNNIYSFCDNAVPTEMLKYILLKLEKPFMDPNKPPEDIKVELNEFLALLTEYVYYGYQIIDKIDRVDMMTREVSIITDTDSTIVSFDAWYNYVNEKVKHLPLKIKTEINRITDSDEGLETVEYVQDYDFATDEVVQLQKLANPFCVVPQDGVRHSIINIIGYCVGQLILEHMYRLSKNYNSCSEFKNCLMVMKNEYLFKRVLVTDGKKNYAAIQEIQEGNIVPASASLAIAGMNIDKSVLQKKTRDRLKQILYDDVLNADKIDQIKILKDIAIAEKEIYNSIRDGRKEYYKPVVIKSMGSYANPMRIQGVKASVAYNAMREEGTEAIDLTIRNGLDIIKTNIDNKTIEKIKDTFPEVYTKGIELLNQDDYANGITAIAIPINVAVPKWVLEFVDYTTIINDNISNFPFEEVGICRKNTGSVNYTNIIPL